MGQRGLEVDFTGGQKSVIALEVESQYAEEAKERQKEAGGDRKSDDYKKSLLATLP